ncbi:MAG: cysteinyl-tRNA synthetase [Chloroflexota bacterium]
MIETHPGQIILLGSGETSPSIRKTYDWLFQQMEKPIRNAILETPAGFEPNSADVAGQIGEYLKKHLQNYDPQVAIIPARKRGSPFSTEDPAILEPMYGADVLFMGPGSPTYTVRQLQNSVAWHTLQACHQMGTTLIFASAASLACSQQTMPVYEIYKVGEELHWKSGLDFFGTYGLSLIFVPHWNNNDGGQALDTSRCYLGQERFGRLKSQLDAIYSDDISSDRSGYTIVGLDEYTALCIDIREEICRVMGQGSVTIIRDDVQSVFGRGESFPIQALGAFQIQAKSDKIPEEIWQRVQSKLAQIQAERQAVSVPTAKVVSLTEEREQARREKNWLRSDELRDEIEANGWSVRDTREGSILEQLKE